MQILLTLYLSGMPLALIVLLWALQGLPEDDWSEVDTFAGWMATAVFVILWPLFLPLALYDAWVER